MEKVVKELWISLKGLDEAEQQIKLYEFAEDIYSEGFSDGFQACDEDEEDDVQEDC